MRSLTRTIKNIYNEYKTFQGKIFNPYLGNRGYYEASFRKNGKQQKILIHRLVAIHFIDNPLNKLQVNHIDGNKKNNHVNNLEWSTAKENTAHSFQIGLSSHEHLNQSVCVYDKNNKLIKPFKSKIDAAKWRKVHPGTISKYLN